MVGSIGDNMSPPRRDGKRKVAGMTGGSAIYSVKYDFSFSMKHSRQSGASRYSYDSRAAAISVSAEHGTSARKPNRKPQDEETTTEHCGGRGCSVCVGPGLRDDDLDNHDDGKRRNNHRVYTRQRHSFERNHWPAPLSLRQDRHLCDQERQNP